MFKSQQSAQMIPAKSQILKPDVVSDVVGGSQVRLLIPSYVSFLDPTDSYLKFKVQITDPRGIVVPDPHAAAHSLIRNLIIRDGANTTTIESIEDYNSMMAMLRPFTEQSSIKHVRELYEGQQSDPNQDGSSLFYPAPSTLAAATTWDTAQTLKRSANEVEVMIKLGAGIFGGSVVPIALLQGLRIQFDTEDPLRALLQPEWVKGSWEGSGGGVALKDQGFTLPADLAEGDIGNRDGSVGANKFVLTTDITTDNTGKGNPFAIGDKIYINHDTGGNGAFAFEQLAGVVSGFYVAGGKLVMALIGQTTVAAGNMPAGALFTTANFSVFYYKSADRESAFTYKLASATDETLGGSQPAVSYTLKDIEFVASSVSPPVAYQQGMMKKAMSKEGVSMDFITPELHRFNQVNTSGIVQSQIPTLAQRAKAVFVQTVPQAYYRVLWASGLSGVPDSAKDYQFVKGTELVPSRPVPLGRYSQIVAGTDAIGGVSQRRNEPLHTSELQKALVNIGQPVYNLQRIAEHFCLARSFNKYGQITNLAGDTLSLRVDYSSAGQQKIFNQFVFKLARLTMAGGQSQVIS
tara:strand:+ start:1597 stop:3324 length:1728 start_codon:yes stop_codon:yes gene_type:complete